MTFSNTEVTSPEEVSVPPQVYFIQSTDGLSRSEILPSDEDDHKEQLEDTNCPIPQEELQLSQTEVAPGIGPSVHGK